MKFRILLAALSVISICSCKSQFELLLNSNDVDAKYKAAFEYFDNKKFSKAASLFESLSMLTEGTEKDDTVKYYWGLSNYNGKDYYTAETNFEKFIESYPRSPFASEARYLRLDCLYRQTLRYELDQTPTYKAMNAISEYIMDYPSSDRLASCRDMLTELGERLDRKAYEGAKLYYKMEDYLASRVAFRNVLKDDSENIYREDILYYIAMSSYEYARLSIPSKQKENVLSSPNLTFGIISIPFDCNQFASALLRYVFHICITSGILRYRLKSGAITPLNFFSLFMYFFGLCQSLSKLSSYS